MSIKLMIADDHPAVRAGVVSLMRGSEIEVVCQAETCKETVERALEVQPDVVLLDVRLTGSDGMRALEQIHRANPAIGVVVFSAVDDVKAMALAHSLGAMGYVPKGVKQEDLLQNIRRVAKGESVWTPRQMRQVVSRAATEALAAHDRNPLSAREAEVLSKIVLGLSNDEISDALGIEVETVKQHVKHILKKLHVEDRTQAALLSLRAELDRSKADGSDEDEA